MAKFVQNNYGKYEECENPVHINRICNNLSVPSNGSKWTVIHEVEGTMHLNGAYVPAEVAIKEEAFELFKLGKDFEAVKTELSNRFSFLCSANDRCKVCVVSDKPWVHEAVARLG